MREGHGVFGMEHSFITRKRDKMNGGGMETGRPAKVMGKRNYEIKPVPIKALTKQQQQSKCVPILKLRM